MTDITLDAELRDVIKALNQVGIETIGSCSGHGDKSAFISIDATKLKSVEISADNPVYKSVLFIRWDMQKEHIPEGKDTHELDSQPKVTVTEESP